MGSPAIEQSLRDFECFAEHLGPEPDADRRVPSMRSAAPGAPETLGGTPALTGGTPATTGGTPLSGWAACAAAELARRAARPRQANRLIQSAQVGADEAVIALRCADVALALGAVRVARAHLNAAIQGINRPSPTATEALVRLEVALGAAESRTAPWPRFASRARRVVAVNPLAAPPRALPAPADAPPLDPAILRWLLALGELTDPVAEARWHSPHLQAAALLHLRGELGAARLWAAAAQAEIERRSLPKDAAETRRLADEHLLDATDVAVRALVDRGARLVVFDLLARLHTRSLVALATTENPAAAAEATHRFARMQGQTWQAMEAAVEVEAVPETWCWLARAAAQRDRPQAAARALRAAERLVPEVPPSGTAVTLGLSWAAMALHAAGRDTHHDRAVAWLRVGLPQDGPHWTRVRGALVFAALTGQAKAATALTQGPLLTRLPPALWPTLALGLVAVGAPRHGQAVLAHAFTGATSPIEAWRIAARVEGCPPLRVVCADHHGPGSAPALERWPFEAHAAWVRERARSGFGDDGQRVALWRRVKDPEQALWALADRIVTPTVMPDAAPLWRSLERPEPTP